MSITEAGQRLCVSVCLSCSGGFSLVCFSWMWWIFSRSYCTDYWHHDVYCNAG